MGLKANVKKDESTPNNIFENLLKEVEKVNPEMGDLQELAALLSLPDEEFKVLSPIYLNEIQKAFNNISDKLLLVQALNASGQRIEDILDGYMEIYEQLDKHFETISVEKRDFLKQILMATYNAIAEAEGVTKRVVQIPIELCHPDAKLPNYANLSDAGLDVYAIEDVIINPGETVLVHTGLKMAIPYGYELQVRPKSGRALKTKMRVANTPGTIDSGYRDEICVIIDNIEPPIKDIAYEFDENGKPVITSILHGCSYSIGKGEKFAQLVLNEIPKVSFLEVSSVSDIPGNRGGGFGSSGIK